MARNIFGGNLIMDTIQNGLCGNCGYTPVKEQVVAPISIKTTPTTTPPAPVPVHQQQVPQAPQVQQQTPAQQQGVYVQPSTGAAMYLGAHAYVQAMRAEQQAQENAANITANQKLADARHKGQVAFNKMVGQAIGECGEVISENAKAIRGLQHRCENAEARAKAQASELAKLKAQQQAQQKAQAAELAKLKAAQAAQQAEIQKLKEHNKVQDKRLDNLEKNMRTANAFMQKFGKKK